MHYRSLYKRKIILNISSERPCSASIYEFLSPKTQIQCNTTLLGHPVLLLKS